MKKYLLVVAFCVGLCVGLVAYATHEREEEVMSSECFSVTKKGERHRYTIGREGQTVVWSDGDVAVFYYNETLPVDWPPVAVENFPVVVEYMDGVITRVWRLLDGARVL